LKEVSNMWLNGRDKLAAQFLSRTFGKPSGLGFKRFNITNISAGIKLTLDNRKPTCI